MQEAVPDRTYGLIFDEERVDLGRPGWVLNPFDHGRIAPACYAGREQLAAGLDLIHRAFPSLAQQPAHKRALWLRAVGAAIEREQDDLARTILAEAGKPIQFARKEVERAARAFREAADLLGRGAGQTHLHDMTPGGEERLSLHLRRPVGPVVSICPFSEPLAVAAREIAAALAVGSSILVKPASQTPLSAIKLGRIALAAGVPPGSVVVAPCQAQDALPLIADDRPGVLSFNGSAQVGWALRSQAGRRRFVCSLSGRPAALVESDADAEAAATTLAIACFACAGQLTHSIQRILIHERMAGRFYDRFLQVISGELATGDPADEAVICGPLIDAAQADRILEWIDQAVAGEARLLIEPQRRQQLISPAVLTKVPPHLPLVTQELFAPVVVLETYRGLHSGLEQLNAPAPGPVVAVFTQDARKLLLAHQLLVHSAVVVHNDSPLSIPPGTPLGDGRPAADGGGSIAERMAAFTESSSLLLRRDATGTGWLR